MDKSIPSEHESTINIQGVEIGSQMFLTLNGSDSKTC